MSKVKWIINTNYLKSVHEQITNRALFAIASGDLKEGDKLPSTRSLSDSLNVNPATISKAYDHLKSVGLVVTRKGTGVFVAEGGKGIAIERAENILILKIAETMREAEASGLKFSKLSKVAKGFNSAMPDELY